MGVILDCPADDIAEITLIGTGGYGECVLVHLGNKNWMVVDSCINPETKSSNALQYLWTIGVNPDLVKLIICTHWHDDHILGISSMLSMCKNAKFSFSKAHDQSKFLYFISKDIQKTKYEKFNSSTVEFNKCIDIIRSRNHSIISAIENKILHSVYHKEFGMLSSEIFSLSPSEFTMEKFDSEIGELIKEFDTVNKRIPHNDPNAKSVALFLKLGHHRAILGADLEVAKNEKEGWLNILKNNLVIDKKSGYFKIPHHGSSNGYHHAIWSDLLLKNPVAAMTSYSKGHGLPTAEMMLNYKTKTDKLYTTSPFISGKAKTRSKSIEKLIKRMNYKLHEIKYKQGIIRSRIKIDEATGSWDVSLIENAIKV